MKNLVCAFASTKYWTDKDELNTIFSLIEPKFTDDTFVSFVDNVPNKKIDYKEYDIATIVVMSGSNQSPSSFRKL